MNVLVYEHVSGGGFAGTQVPPSVLSEGFSMLRSLVADFKAAGHTVTTMLDSRIAKFTPPLNADCIVPVFAQKEIQEIISKNAASADAAYVIAPESEGVLQSLLETVEKTGVASLNCAADVIGKVADKAVLHKFLSELDVPQPETMVFGAEAYAEEVKRAVTGKLRLPLVFKPSCDVSCGGLSLARNERQIAAAVAKIRRECVSKRFLVQEFIRGAAASVSVISTGGEAMPISLNCQDIALKTPDGASVYRGGLVPFEHPMQFKAFATAEKIVKSFPGLRGYVGVDLVLTNEEAFVIEVNPRLTTSYVGLRRVVNFNPAEAIVNAVLKSELPTNVQACGHVLFSKVELPPPTPNILQTIYEMSEVAAPPFPLSSSSACALISAYGITVKAATARFREAKKRILKVAQGGE
ncbi:MAG: ATP-grasp domain-containing protein [Candidatus Bathyarchaeota archaeon]|nr:ATP-grasp domain-containing protein [Candidatus Bathyarchaeota archaeon]